MISDFTVNRYQLKTSSRDKFAYDYMRVEGYVREGGNLLPQNLS
jgi:hypothetical protein